MYEKNKVTIKYITKRIMESYQWYILLLPGLVYLLVFMYGPMYGLQIAFKDYRVSKGILGSEWLGFYHFYHFFRMPIFWKLIKNTLSITLLSLTTFPFPIIFALLLNELGNVRVKKFVQMITYMPHFLSEVVVCSLVIMFLDRTTGPINNMRAFFGAERYAYMTDPDAFSMIYVLSGLWQNIGWSSILYISALSAVSLDEVEAATIDGANRFQIMLHVYIPCIMPTIIITLLLTVGRIMNVGFSKILLLQNDLNLERSNVISTYVYNVGLLSGQYSMSSAVGLFNNLVNIIVLMLVNGIVKSVSETSLF